MLYNWIYWRSANASAPICSLPGCTWVTDNQKYNWCFRVGAISPDASYTGSPYLANVAPFAWPTDYPYDYAYDLIPNPTTAYQWLGPFICDDQTLTCSTPLPQDQAFPSS